MHFRALQISHTIVSALDQHSRVFALPQQSWQLRHISEMEQLAVLTIAGTDSSGGAGIQVLIEVVHIECC